MLTNALARIAMTALGATLLLTAACKDDEVVANLTCGNDLCEPAEDFENCPQDCAGPQFPGPCFGESTAVASAGPNPDYLYDYAMVDGNLRVSLIWDREPYGDDHQQMHFTFDELGKTVMVETDSEDDGVIDYIRLKSFDEQGRCTREEEWSTVGAELLAVTTHVRDATGYLVRSTSESVDSQLDPVALLSEITYEWSADYLVCMERHDMDGNGSQEYFVEVTYDSTGLVVSRRQAASLCEFTYDRANLYDMAPGAILPLPFGDIKMKQPLRLLSYHCTLTDGSGENGESYIYDEYGNLLRTEFSHVNTFPNPSHITTFTYDCWQ